MHIDRALFDINVRAPDSVKQLRAANAEVEQGEALLEAKQDAIAERTAQLMETKARARRLREQLEAEEDAHGRESWAALQAQPDL